MMFTEQKIRNFIRKFLLESEQTRRPGRGGYKKQIQAAGALAKSNPSELMKRLKISGVSGENDIKKLHNLLDQASTGDEAMTGVFGAPQPRRDKRTSLEGIRVPVKVIPPRDARKYLEHTLIGAQLSSTALFVEDIQIEILGNDVLLYFSAKPYSWGRDPSSKKKKSNSNPPDQQPAQESKGEDKKQILGEPDLNPDRDSEDADEASVSGMVSGPMTPLGTGPRYPDKPEKEPDDPAEIAGRAFGDANPVKKKNKKN
jgi:hypothetical protein